MKEDIEGNCGCFCRCVMFCQMLLLLPQKKAGFVAKRQSKQILSVNAWRCRRAVINFIVTIMTKEKYW